VIDEDGVPQNASQMERELAAQRAGAAAETANTVRVVICVRARVRVLSAFGV
jgi:hypothetical protein